MGRIDRFSFTTPVGNHEVSEGTAEPVAKLGEGAATRKCCGMIMGARRGLLVYHRGGWGKGGYHFTTPVDFACEIEGTIEPGGVY